MTPGSIVQCRNREWVLLPGDQENLLVLRPLPTAIAAALPVTKSGHWFVSFISSTPEGVEYLGRNHRFVATLAQFLMEEALTKGAAARASRCGVMRTRAVSRMLDVQAAWTDHPDLWLSLRTLFHLFQDDKLSAILELSPLNGELFQMQTLDGCTLSNRELLRAFWYLAYYQERAGASIWRHKHPAISSTASTG